MTSRPRQRAHPSYCEPTKKLADLDRGVWLRLWRLLTKRQGSRGRLHPAAFAECERQSGLAYFLGATTNF